MPAPEIEDFDHVVLTARDLEATVEFYENVVGMEVRSFPSETGGVRWALHFGQRKINLHQAGAEFRPNAAAAAPGCVDLCLLTSTPLAAVQEHLASEGVELELGPDWADGATGELSSVWFRDPDENLIEVANRA